MAYLKLPLSITFDGFFRRTELDTELLQRIKFFVVSGISKFILLPSKGISTLWMHLLTMGQTAKFCSNNIFPEEERNILEEKIKVEINEWLKLDNVKINEVKVIGDEHNPNGLRFKTRENEYIVTFEYERNDMDNSINLYGNWRITEFVK
jgi:hypothetical protein